MLSVKRGEPHYPAQASRPCSVLSFGVVAYSPSQPYLFQDLDLTKIAKIIKCETSTNGA